MNNNIRPAPSKEKCQDMGMVTNAEQNKAQMEIDFPPVGMAVIVQCEGFRCIAYRTEGGQWKSLYGNEILKNVVQFYPDSAEDTID
jgi:hypothetical protein